jgi:hypothetical protein
MVGGGGTSTGGVEGGVGGAKLVVAGRFEGAIEVTQRPAVGVRDLPAQRAQLARSVNHGADFLQRVPRRRFVLISFAAFILFAGLFKLRPFPTSFGS